MRYATWRLNWTDPMYGTGPEEVIAGRGGRAEASVANATVEDGYIVGYVFGDFDSSGLEAWDFSEITADQALAFAQDVDSGTWIDEEGIIRFPFHEAAL